jgi:hypothetical protein
MRYIFTSLGGSGSFHLRNRLRSLGYETVWTPTHPWPVFRIAEDETLVHDPEYLAENYDRPPTEREVKGFYKQAKDGLQGFKIDPKVSVAENMAEYLRTVQRSEKGTTILRPGCRLFSRLGIREVVFNIRHPMHAYLSLVKPKRHPHYAYRFGGVNTTSAIEFYANLFNTVVDEYFACLRAELRPILMRYEFVAPTLATLGDPILTKVYGRWDSTRRNSGLTPESEKHLRDKVADRFFAIYDNWHV